MAQREAPKPGNSRATDDDFEFPDAFSLDKLKCALSKLKRGVVEEAKLRLHLLDEMKKFPEESQERKLLQEWTANIEENRLHTLEYFSTLISFLTTAEANLQYQKRLLRADMETQLTALNKQKIELENLRRKEDKVSYLKIVALIVIPSIVLATMLIPLIIFVPSMLFPVTWFLSGLGLVLRIAAYILPIILPAEIILPSIGPLIAPFSNWVYKPLENIQTQIKQLNRQQKALKEKMLFLDESPERTNCFQKFNTSDSLIEELKQDSKELSQLGIEPEGLQKAWIRAEGNSSTITSLSIFNSCTQISEKGLAGLTARL